MRGRIKVSREWGGGGEVRQRDTEGEEENALKGLTGRRR